MTGTVTHAMLPVEIAGEQMVLLADRGLYWSARATLLIADPHFGKAATFRMAGLFVPKGTTALALQRLDHLVRQTGATRMVFLGDFLHAREGRSESMLAEVAAWRSKHAGVELVLVRGNHDRRAGDPPAEFGVTCVDAPLIQGPFALAHHPVAVPGAYVLAGHLHPCITLRGAGRQRERLPCFWMGQEVGVLPAFGEFTGCAPVSPAEGDRVWVVAGQEIVPVW